MKALSGLCGPAVRNGSNDCLFVQADGYAVRNRRHASQSGGSDLVAWSCRHWLKFAPPWSTRRYPVLGITFRTLVRDPPRGCGCYSATCNTWPYGSPLLGISDFEASARG